MAEDRIIARGLRDAGHDFVAQFRPRSPRFHMKFAADQFTRFLENATGARVDEMIEGTPHSRIRSDAARAVRAAADRADHELVQPHRHALLRGQLLARAAYPVHTVLDRAAGATFFLNRQDFNRPAACTHRVHQVVLVHALATERHKQHRAHVRVRGETLEHLLCVAVRIAARKADQMHRGFTLGVRVVEGIEGLTKLRDDFTRDVMRTLNEVCDRHHISNALAAVVAQVALQHGLRNASSAGCFGSLSHDRFRAASDRVSDARIRGRHRACTWGYSRFRGCACAGARRAPRLRSHGRSLRRSATLSRPY